MRARRQEPDGAEADPVRPQAAAPHAPDAATLLRLQQSAGNQAVTAMLQRTRSRRRGGQAGPAERTRERTRARDEKASPGEHESMEPTPGELARDEDATYEAALREFARATRHMEFSFTDQRPKFDATCWRCVVTITWEDGKRRKKVDYATVARKWSSLVEQADELEFEYVLLPGCEPSTAIRQIVSEPHHWAMDCIDYVVAARLYAECELVGDEAFDAKYGNLGSEISPEPMRMAQHATPGLTAKDFWRREEQGEEFMSWKWREPTGVAPASAEEEDRFLKGVPVGARVMWTSSHPDAADSDFENENTIKIGPDLYAAHPVGRLSGMGVRKEMVVDGTAKADEEKQIADHVYLAEIEWYDRA